ncbi:MAG: hypothetical protein LBP85_06925 [Prevotellaceae bacterium]|jgi:hypothetical protein|nr:hypothetical protein [Prevotellaceae bacterium]
MVSLEEQLTYSQMIETIPKLSALKNLLCGQSIVFPVDARISNTDKIYYEIITAIQANNKNKFVEFFNKKNKGNPNKDTPFVHDDYLIFSLIIGIIKFDCNKEWIKSVIAVRTKNGITITFENILNRNFNHSDNNKSVVFMYFHLIDPTQITAEFANETFKSINSNSKLFQNKNDFLIICTLISYNQIIELKNLPESDKIALLKSFETRFTKRLKVLAWTIQTLVLVLFLYVILKLISIRPEIELFLNQIGTIFTILGLIGISQFGNISKWLKNLFYRMLLLLFGYPKKLLKK